MSLRVITEVLRSEGWSSAWRRTHERLQEELRLRLQLLRGTRRQAPQSRVLNVCGMPLRARLGGLPIQLRARLREEARWRPLALFHPGILEGQRHAVRASSFTQAIADSGARIVHVEGSFGLDLTALTALPGALQLILSLHDLDLLHAPAAQRDALLARADRLVFASSFLQQAYNKAGTVIEPGTAAVALPTAADGHRHHLAWVGSLKPHKGAALLPRLIQATPGARWHVLGGGDAELLRPLRGLPHVQLRGYYRSSELPQLLVRHGIGLAVLPSLVPEGFGLTLSECWLAGVPALVFDHGAQAQRIRRDGGGWCVPLEHAGSALAQQLQHWLAGVLEAPDMPVPPSALDAAHAHLQLYAQLPD